MDWQAVAVFMCIGWLVDPYIAGALDSQFTKMVLIDAHCDDARRPVRVASNVDNLTCKLTCIKNLLDSCGMLRVHA